MTGGSDVTLIFGGTFDPPHRAHIELPALVAQRLGGARLRYIPAAESPHKVGEVMTPAADRLAMLRLAVEDAAAREAGTGEVTIDEIELNRGGTSYMIDTIEALAAPEQGLGTLRLLIGSDQAAAFHRWRDWQRLVELAEPVIMRRGDEDAKSLEHALMAAHGPAGAKRWLQRIIDVPALSVSATDIRQRVRSGDDITTLVTPQVAAYIRSHKLYLDAC